MSHLPDDLITPKQASRILRTHISTTYRLIHRGRLRAWRRLGLRYLVSQADVRALLEPAGKGPPREVNGHTADVLRRAGFRPG